MSATSYLVAAGRNLPSYPLPSGLPCYGPEFTAYVCLVQAGLPLLHHTNSAICRLSLPPRHRYALHCSSEHHAQHQYRDPDGARASPNRKEPTIKHLD